ncbi:probable WRKY transcription factor 48 isoform X2 [Phragmites australis]|uniref:probable WRKY transcription factor 48 isoform X2 n=1 Tax=Phragmites australis TaxID=29695 RepID=UPI002D76B828|nr:probable WRKY transcription factor 48 isoform X2 [Phragmites australis]
MSGARYDHGGGHQHHLSGDFQFHDELASLFAQRLDAATPMQQPWLFTDYLQASASTPLDYDAFAGEFDMPAVEEVKRELVVDTGAASGGGMPGSGGGTSTAPLTPNSMSMSSTSSEACGTCAGAGEESAAGKCKKEEGEMEESKDGSAAAKGDGEGEDKSKKGAAKGKGKGEKRPRQPRFAFMTKSEVDHLEDGYRWRKYGQKAVKNSPFPRSYYRCTTQKCQVKKRVERSYQDAAVVVTTYEGKHTHPIPVTLRGSTHLLAAHHANLHHTHFRMPPPPPQPIRGPGFAFQPGATAFDSIGLLQPQQGHRHAMQKLVSGAGVATGVHAYQVNAAVSSHALPDQHGLSAIVGTAVTATATVATTSAPLRMQHFMAQDYAGLLQDMLPSFVHNNDVDNNRHP